MAVTHEPVFTQLAKNPVVQILPADTTTLKTLLTPAADGTRIEAILINSSDTSAKDIQFTITKGGVDLPLVTISIPANTGFTSSVPGINALAHANFVGLCVDGNGNKYLDLESGSVLKVKALSTVTTAKAISFITQSKDF